MMCHSLGHRPRNDSFNTEQTSHADSPASAGDAAAADNKDAEVQRKSKRSPLRHVGPH